MSKVFALFFCRCSHFGIIHLIKLHFLHSFLLRYEERIIELHSVIAELSKKMEEEKDDVIKEESECDESQVLRINNNNQQLNINNLGKLL